MYTSILDPGGWSEILTTKLEGLVGAIPNLVMLVLFYFITRRLINLIIKRIQKRRSDWYDEQHDSEGKKRMFTLTELLRSVQLIALSIIVVMVALSQLGLNIGPILAGAGIVGLAVGFGSQELVRDVISGFFMLIEDQIRVGDVVSINGTTAAVEKIEIRTITLRDSAGVVHIFQNGKINTVSNLTKEWSAAVFDIGVAYKEDYDTVCKIMLRVGEHLQHDALFKNSIVAPMEIMGLDSFGESEIVIKGRIKTKPGDQWKVGREYRRRLKIEFDAEGIEIPYPHRTLLWGGTEAPKELAQSA